MHTTTSEGFLHAVSRGRVLAASLAFVLGLEACVGSVVSVTDHLRVREPRLVQVDVSGPVGAASVGGEAVLGQGTVALRQGGRTAFTVRAGRTDGGAPEVRWDTRLGLVSGERLALVSPDHRIARDAALADAATPWIAAQGATLVVPGCTTLAQAWSPVTRSGRTTVPSFPIGHRVGVSMPCAADASAEATVPFRLSTPWSNVMEATRTVVHGPGEAFGTLVGLAVFAFIASATLLGVGIAKDHRDGQGEGLTVAGVAGIVLSPFLIPVAFAAAPTTTETVPLPLH